MSKSAQQVRRYAEALPGEWPLLLIVWDVGYCFVIKRLEGEVLNALKEFGDRETPLLTFDPHQFWGIEINPRAAAIADLVMWIGYLQWHFRTRGKTNPPEPVPHNFHNIECRDAVLAHDGTEPEFDTDGKSVTRWDGRNSSKAL